MSAALPGQHYCVNHQGNYSHYAEHNCIVCQLLAALRDIRQMANLRNPPDIMAIFNRANAALAKAEGQS